MSNSFAGEGEVEVDDVDSPDWAKDMEKDVEEDEESSGSSSSLEFVASPTHSSTGLKKKKKRRSRTDKMAKELRRELEKSGSGESSRRTDLEKIMAFTSNLVQGLNMSKKRKGEDKEIMPEVRVMIDEELKVKDNGHKVVAWKVRNMLRPINGDPEKYWHEGTWEAEVGPVLNTLVPTQYQPKDDPGGV